MAGFSTQGKDFNDIEPITGPIKLDKYGDRVNTFLFWHLDKKGEWQVRIGDRVSSFLTPSFLILDFLIFDFIEDFWILFTW